jgi:hypothetical protein
VALYVEAIAAVFSLVVFEVADDFGLVIGREDGIETSCGVEANDQAWEEEHGATIIARPVAVGGLEGFVEREAVAEGGGDGVRWEGFVLLRRSCADLGDTEWA